ncbi:MAG: hypothetical protein R2713_20980 [Ilumatobacteraceae bacterium]
MRGAVGSGGSSTGRPPAFATARLYGWLLERVATALVGERQHASADPDQRRAGVVDEFGAHRLT